jgi:citrate lyase subunit beta / citryl-CoA lyase
MDLDIRHLRSWLFVPGDSERKFLSALSSAADALIIDLEDSVLPSNKATARSTTARLLADAAGSCPAGGLFVRVNSTDSGHGIDDIRVVVAARARGLVLPKITSAAELRQIVALVENAEAATPGHSGRTRLIPIATESPAAVFRLDEIARAHHRVAGLAWGMEDLGAEMGARRTRRADGRMLEVFSCVRSLALLAATGAGLAALDTPVIDLEAGAQLADEAGEAADMGFTGKMAIHPAQVAAINTAFSVSSAELAHARAILALSATGGGAAFRYKGRMVDTPHLLAARRLIEKAGGGPA